MVKQGDIIKLDFNPVKGHEQAGYRPAVIISNNFVLSKTNIISVCPITSKRSRTAMNVPLDERTVTRGVILCAHIKSVDLENRNYTFVESVPDDLLDEIIDTAISLIARA